MILIVKVLWSNICEDYYLYKLCSETPLWNDSWICYFTTICFIINKVTKQKLNEITSGKWLFKEKTQTLLFVILILRISYIQLVYRATVVLKGNMALFSTILNIMKSQTILTCGVVNNT